MARRLATLPVGSRITDYISLGVIAKFFPLEKVRGVLKETGRASVRERDCQRMWWCATSSPWRCTCGPPTARCCAVC